jgi:Cu2+-exporting ATPase
VGRGLAARVDGRLVLVGSARFMLGHQIDLGPGLALADAHHAEGFATQYVAADGHLVGLLGTRDEARPESLEIVRRLQAQGRQVVLLSGDAQPVVQAIARELGIDQAFGGLLPEDKAARVQALQAQGHTVAMVGDGINDAPALALADVGLSLKGSTDLALETADGVLLEGSLEKLPDAFLVAEEAMATVKRGLGLVLVPNAVAIALGAAGLLSPGLAALTNNGSTVVATLSALWPILRTPRSK